MSRCTILSSTLSSLDDDLRYIIVPLLWKIKQPKYRLLLLQTLPSFPEYTNALYITKKTATSEARRYSQGSSYRNAFITWKVGVVMIDCKKSRMTAMELLDARLITTPKYRTVYNSQEYQDFKEWFQNDIRKIKAVTDIFDNLQI